MKTQREIEALVAGLAEARRALDTTKETLTAARRKFDEEHADLITAERELANLVHNRELEVRDAVEEVYRLTGIRRPADGVSVRLVRRLTYDTDAAVAWAAANKHLTLLKLDRPAFERVAQGLKPDFVAIEEVPQATITADLDKAVARTEAATAAEAVFAEDIRQHYHTENEWRQGVQRMRKVDPETGEITEDANG
jgi:hypothetical protein